MGADPLFASGSTAAAGVAPPQSTALVVVDHTIRCAGEVRDLARKRGRGDGTCGWLWTEHYAARPWKFRCPRCGALNSST